MAIGVSESIQSKLVMSSPENFVIRHVLAGTPYVFQNDYSSFCKWRAEAAKLLGVDASAIIVVGSACLGVSLKDSKLFSAFTDQSDIDIAVVSAPHFEIAWNTLLTVGTSRHLWTRKEKQSLNEHRERLIYWGTIATDQILGRMPFGQDWLKATSQLSDNQHINNRSINFRVYKDIAAIRRYQTIAVSAAREHLLGESP